MIFLQHTVWCKTVRSEVFQYSISGSEKYQNDFPPKIGMIRPIIHFKWNFFLNVSSCGLLDIFVDPNVAQFSSSSTTLRSDCCRLFLTSPCAPEAQV